MFRLRLAVHNMFINGWSVRSCAGLLIAILASSPHSNCIHPFEANIKAFSSGAMDLARNKACACHMGWRFFVNNWMPFSSLNLINIDNINLKNMDKD